MAQVEQCPVDAPPAGLRLGDAMPLSRDVDSPPQDGRLRSSYDGSNILFRVLLMHGWGPLLNFGYFDWRSFFTLFSLPVAQRNLVRKAIARLQLARDEEALDVACGRGWSTSYIAASHPVRRAVGVDLLEDHVRVSRTLYGNTPRVEYHQGDATRLEFEDASFDALSCIEAAFHFNRRRFLAEAARVLRPGGRAVIVDFMWTERPQPKLLEDPRTAAVRSVWSWEDFDSIEEYRANAHQVGLSVRTIEDWSRPVTASIHALFHLISSAGRNAAGRALLTAFNRQLRSLSHADWHELAELVRAHDHVRRLSRYVAITLVKE